MVINTNKTNLAELTEHKKKTTTYDVCNPNPGLGQTQKCGGDKPVMEPVTIFIQLQNASRNDAL